LPICFLEAAGALGLEGLIEQVPHGNATHAGAPVKPGQKHKHRSILKIKTLSYQSQPPKTKEKCAVEPNRKVTVEMLVKAAKNCQHCLQVFLDSEADHRDPM